MGLDRKPTRSINIALPLKKSSRGAFEVNESTVDAVADDLKNLISTNHFERVIHGDFGANLRPIIFNQGPDVVDQISDAIHAAVERWMPFVNLLEVLVTTSTENPSLHPNEVNIRIKFSVGRTALQGETELTVTG
jgi:phage baseplate assembly protein W